VSTVPLDEGPPGRRRAGRFWIEDGTGPLLAGGAIVAIALCLYILAVVLDHA